MSILNQAMGGMTGSGLTYGGVTPVPGMPGDYTYQQQQPSQPPTYTAPNGGGWTTAMPPMGRNAMFGGGMSQLPGQGGYSSTGGTPAGFGSPPGQMSPAGPGGMAPSPSSPPSPTNGMGALAQNTSQSPASPTASPASPTPQPSPALAQNTAQSPSSPAASTPGSSTPPSPFDSNMQAANDARNQFMQNLAGTGANGLGTNAAAQGSQFGSTGNPSAGMTPNGSGGYSPTQAGAGQNQPSSNPFQSQQNLQNFNAANPNGTAQNPTNWWNQPQMQGGSPAAAPTGMDTAQTPTGPAAAQIGGAMGGTTDSGLTYGGATPVPGALGANTMRHPAWNNMRRG